jgi:hypothetical protein
MKKRADSLIYFISLMPLHIVLTFPHSLAL